MPDPLLYLQTMCAAAIASAVTALAILLARRKASDYGWTIACVLAFAFGLATGAWALPLSLAWPPVNGLERLLLIVVPAVLLIESIAASPRVAFPVVITLRTLVIVMTPRILLHRSVYLSDASQWTAFQTFAALGLCCLAFAICWALLLRLSQRPAGTSVALSLCLAIQSAGLTVMMAGYLKGGEAAFLIAAVLLATTATLGAVQMWRPDATTTLPPVLIGIGILGLFGILFIGHFFGRISTERGLAMLSAPLLGWITEVPMLQIRNPWILFLVRLSFVSIPLIFVLVLAKSDFDQEMLPLVMSQSQLRIADE